MKKELNSGKVWGEMLLEAKFLMKQQYRVFLVLTKNLEFLHYRTTMDFVKNIDIDSFNLDFYNNFFLVG